MKEEELKEKLVDEIIEFLDSPDNDKIGFDSKEEKEEAKNDLMEEGLEFIKKFHRKFFQTVIDDIQEDYEKGEGIFKEKETD